jgi:hypothetical protein
MLSLREAASPPNSEGPTTYLLSEATRRTADVILIHRDSGVTYSYDDQSQATQPDEYDDWNHKQGNPGQKSGEFHEMKNPGRSTARASLEMD